jgi:hypothetical protein
LTRASQKLTNRNPGSIASVERSTTLVKQDETVVIALWFAIVAAIEATAVS